MRYEVKKKSTFKTEQVQLTKEIARRMLAEKKLQAAVTLLVFLRP